MPFCPLFEQNGKSWPEYFATCKIATEKTPRNSHNTFQIFKVYVKKLEKAQEMFLKWLDFRGLTMNFVVSSVQAVFRGGKQDFGQHYAVWAALGQDLGRVWAAFRQHRAVF